MSTASTPWSAHRPDALEARPSRRPSLWPWFAALGLFLMGIGATIGGVGGDSTPTRVRTAVALAATEQQNQALSAQLTAIEPALAGMTAERVSASAALTCADLRSGYPAEDMAARTAARFGGGGYRLTDRQTTEILSAVRSSFCGLSAFAPPG